MGLTECQEWLGPDLIATESLKPLEDPQFVAVSHAPGPVLGVWGATARAPALGPFGRLRALHAAIAGEPAGPPFTLRPFLKLVVYGPLSHLESVRQTVGDAGAGEIGEYSHCSFLGVGEGSFLPGKAAHPFIGNPGEIERVREFRLETVVPEWRREPVEAALLNVHPYEEPAFDWFKLENPLTIARCVQKKGEWWCDRVDETVLEAALSERPLHIHTERIGWNQRIELQQAGIALTIDEPGGLLLPGLRILWKERRAPWQ